MKKDNRDLKKWEEMEMNYVGDVHEIVQESTGGGKSPVITGDPGEPQKVPEDI